MCRLSRELKCVHRCSYFHCRYGLQIADKKFTEGEPQQFVRSIDGVKHFTRRFFPLVNKGQFVGLDDEAHREFKLSGVQKELDVIVFSTEAEGVTFSGDPRLHAISTFVIDTTALPAGTKVRVHFKFGGTMLDVYARTLDGTILNSWQGKINF